VRHRNLRIQPDDGLELGFGLEDLLVEAQLPAEVEMRLPVIGVEADRLAIAFNGLGATV
jgi:hypothetical protein